MLNFLKIILGAYIRCVRLQYRKSQRGFLKIGNRSTISRIETYQSFPALDLLIFLFHDYGFSLQAFTNALCEAFHSRKKGNNKFDYIIHIDVKKFYESEFVKEYQGSIGLLFLCELVYTLYTDMVVFQRTNDANAISDLYLKGHPGITVERKPYHEN